MKTLLVLTKDLPPFSDARLVGNRTTFAELGYFGCGCTVSYNRCCRFGEFGIHPGASEFGIHSARFDLVRQDRVRGLARPSRRDELPETVRGVRHGSHGQVPTENVAGRSGRYVLRHAWCYDANCRIHLSPFAGNLWFIVLLYDLSMSVE